MILNVNEVLTKSVADEKYWSINIQIVKVIAW